MGVCRPILQILTLFQTKKCHFSHPFSDLVSKTHTHSQTWPSRIVSSLLRLEQQQNWNSHISLSFFSFEIETKNTVVHSRSSFETIHVPDSRFQMRKFYTRLFGPKRRKSLPFLVYIGECLPILFTVNNLFCFLFHIDRVKRLKKVFKKLKMVCF